MRSVVLTLVLVMTARPVWAAACSIEGHNGPAVAEVKASMAQPVYYHSMSKRALTAENKRLGYGQQELGLTRTSFILWVTPHAYFLDQANGRGCMIVDRIDVDWRIDSVRVDIASDYVTDSCQYRVVKEHEDQHVQLTRDAFTHHVPAMRQSVAQLTAGLTPRLYSGDRQTALQRVTEEWKAQLGPIVSAFETESRRLNGTIDTPENYARTSRRCPQW